MSERDELARFQAALLETLADARDPNEAIAKLRRDPASASFGSWVDGCEARGVETAMEMVRLWGARTYTAPEGTMRASVLEAIGELREREVPVPTPGPGQARLRVRACGVCGTDLHAFRGRFRVPLPIVLGHEAVGVVDAIGEGVTHVAIGDRVGVPWLQRGCGECPECARARPKYCPRQINWMTNGGAFAEHMLVEAEACVALPRSLAFDQAAPLFCAGFTAMSGYRRARALPGDRIAVLGVGGLGHLAIQIARAHGHEVIAITRSRAKQRDALELGAHEVLVVREHAGRELARMGGADVVLSTTDDPEQAGGAVLGLRNEGRLVALGIGGPLRLDPLALAARQASVVGALQDRREDLSDLLDLAARGEIRVRSEPHRATHARRALFRLAEGRVRYRGVLLYTLSS